MPALAPSKIPLCCEQRWRVLLFFVVICLLFVCICFCFEKATQLRKNEKRKKMKEKKSKWLLLSKVEEKVHYKYVEEHSQKQILLGKSRVIVTLNHVGRVGRRGREWRFGLLFCIVMSILTLVVSWRSESSHTQSDAIWTSFLILNFAAGQRGKWVSGPELGSLC